jgi:hypothetical protein
MFKYLVKESPKRKCLKQDFADIHKVPLYEYIPT